MALRASARSRCIVKSNSRRAAFLLALATALAAAVAIGALRPGLATTYGKVRERSDVYSLPKPEQVVVVSLGYRAAHVKQLLRDKLIEHQYYINEYGEDMPEIRDWKWPY